MKEDLRREALALRLQGKSYREIQQFVSVSKSTLSLWLRDTPLTDEHGEVLRQKAVAAAERRGQSHRAAAARRRDVLQARARSQVVGLSAKELFVAGVVAYWAEGAKNKPWRTATRVQFVNSDPSLVRLFLQWLSLIGVDSGRLAFRVAIHESGHVEEALRYWSSVTGVPESAFSKTTIKKHNAKSTRRNIGRSYHGCLAVIVRRSSELNLEIAGWWDGIASAATRFEAGGSVPTVESGVARGPE
ncbi:MAG: hypothetical protein M3N68_02710 [Actinomycetota bacterium]|nr:hypothetical protein [Actinomycetota bacterium]